MLRRNSRNNRPFNSIISSAKNVNCNCQPIEVARDGLGFYRLPSILFRPKLRNYCFMVISNTLMQMCHTENFESICSVCTCRSIYIDVLSIAEFWLSQMQIILNEEIVIAKIVRQLANKNCRSFQMSCFDCNLNWQKWDTKVLDLHGDRNNKLVYCRLFRCLLWDRNSFWPFFVYLDSNSSDNFCMEFFVSFHTEDTQWLQSRNFIA